MRDVSEIAVTKKDDGTATVSSKQVAEHFGKIHRDVMRSIKNLECSDEFRVRNYAQSYYLSNQNKKLQCYEMTKDGFSFLAMGFTGKKAAYWKEAYIHAFNVMAESYVEQQESVMALLDKAVALMEDDKDKASAFGKGLSEWKRQRKEHQFEIKRLVSRAQIDFGFDV